MLCNRLLKGVVQATYVPIAAIGMAVFGIDLYFATQHNGAPARRAGAADEAGQFLADTHHWRIIVDLCLIAVAGGAFQAVPLYAIVQKNSNPESRIPRAPDRRSQHHERGLYGGLLHRQRRAAEDDVRHPCRSFSPSRSPTCWSRPDIAQLLPDALFRSVVRAILGWIYGVEVRGLENFEAAGERVLIVANHTLVSSTPR